MASPDHASDEALGANADDAPAIRRNADIDNRRAIKDLRIEHILGLMRDGQFRTGKTAKALAAQWGLSLDYVRELTAAASHQARAQMTSPDALAAEVIPGLLSTYHEAVVDGDAKAVHSLGGLLLDMAGLKAPKKLEHSSKDGLGGLLALAFPGAPSTPDDE